MRRALAITMFVGLTGTACWAVFKWFGLGTATAEGLIALWVGSIGTSYVWADQQKRDSAEVR